MSEKLKKVYGKFRGDKKLLIIFIIAIIGIALLFIGSPEKKSDTKSNSEASDIAGEEQRIAEKLEKLLSGVAGVGKVKVLVSLECMEEKIIAQNSEQKNDNSSSYEKNEFVIIEQGSDDDGLVLKIITPVVRGVAVSCEGGGSAEVQQEITKLITAGLGISSNHVYVTKMESRK